MLALAFQIGYTLIAILGGCIGLGYLADRYFHCSPIGILIGTALGIVGMFYTILAETKE